MKKFFFVLVGLILIVVALLLVIPVEKVSFVPEPVFLNCDFTDRYFSNIETVFGITQNQVKTMDCNLFMMDATAVFDGEEIILRHVITRTGAMSENSAWCFSTLNQATFLAIKNEVCNGSEECLSGKFDQNVNGRYIFSYESGSSASSHTSWGPEIWEVC